MSNAATLLELTRGSIIEAAHSGSIAIVTSDGTLLNSKGDPYAVAFLRSAAKPFQILPFVEAGGLEHYNYTQQELAISCSSHETAQIHLDVIAALQRKVGVSEAELQCGPHLPGDAHKLREVIQQNLSPTSNYNNCSGKHTSMLAFAKMRGLAIENYLSTEHPIQQDILQMIAEMCCINKEDVQLGTDGCSAPNFALPLFNAARGVARLCDPRDLSESRAAACKKVVNAMISHPEMIGNHGEFDTELMQACNGKVITKRGAEGFQIVGIMPGVIHEQGVGIAIKISDGDKTSMDNDLNSHVRVRPPVALEILRQLGAINAEQLRTLAKFGPEKILKNYAGLTTGKMYPAFKL